MSAENSAVTNKLDKSKDQHDTKLKKESSWKLEVVKNDAISSTRFDLYNMGSIGYHDYSLIRIVLPSDMQKLSIEIYRRLFKIDLKVTSELFGIENAVLVPMEDSNGIMVSWGMDFANSPKGLLQRTNIFNYLRKLGAINDSLEPIEFTKILNPMLYVEREIEKERNLKPYGNLYCNKIFLPFMNIIENV